MNETDKQEIHEVLNVYYFTQQQSKYNGFQ
jgi:hypothetical protein